MPFTQQISNPTHIQPIIPAKVGFMGEQGTGKTASAGLFAAALSKQFHGGAPIYVTDLRLPGWGTSFTWISTCPTP